MKNIKFVMDGITLLEDEGGEGLLIVLTYVPVYTTLTACEKNYRVRSMSDHQEPDHIPSAGLTLQEWLESSGMSYSAFSRLVPCSIAYPGLIARGRARPSYEMAVRIEAITGGMVPRTMWYPTGQQPANPQASIEAPDIEDLIK